VVDDTAPATHLAGRGCRARAGADAVARRALGIAREMERGGDALHGVLEVEREVGAQIGAAARADTAAPTAAAPAEHLAAQVGPVAALHVADVEREPAGASARTAERTHPADLVVLLALGLVAEHVVGGRDLLEALLGGGVTRVLVGVELARELPVRLGDVLLRGVGTDAEQLVVVLL